MTLHARESTERSWLKHELLNKIVLAQGAIGALHERAILIDGNAGDGVGIPRNGAMELSHPTPQILTELAFLLGNADVCLCDGAHRKRALLRRRFPSATIVETHSDILEVVRSGNYDYALWLSDPCGYSGHGVGAMRVIAQTIPDSDFIIAFNEGSLNRIAYSTHRHVGLQRKVFADMMRPGWWVHELDKGFMTRTPIIEQSRGFRYRVLLLSNNPCDAARRSPFTEIFRCHK